MIVRRNSAGVRRQPETQRRARRAALLASALLTCAGSAAPATAAVPTPPATAPTNATFRTEAMPQPASAARTATPASKRTTTLRLRSRKRFSLAGLRWDSSQPLAGRMRAKRTDGSWSPWAEIESEERRADGVTESDDRDALRAARRNAKRFAAPSSTEPIWTGPARLLEVELQGRVPRGLRAALVDVSGRATVQARAARRNAAGIQPRSSWDPGDACKPRTSPAVGMVQGVTVHHTAGNNAYTQAQVPAVILAICKYHRNSLGWNDVGYNVIVDKYGGAWEGRAGGLDRAVVGAHAQGFNAVAAGISLIGDYSAVAPPPAAVATIGRVAAWKLAVSGAPTSGDVTLTSAGGSASKVGAGRTITLPRVFAHRDVGQTACPGNVGYAHMDAIRATAAGTNPGVVAPPAAPPTTGNAATISISTKRALTVGQTSVVTGTAKRGGQPLGRTSVALQIGMEDTWSTVDRDTTNARGEYRFSRKFTRNWDMRVVHTGDGGGQSRAVEVTFAPKLSLSVPKRLSVGRKRTLRGSIAPGRGPVELEVYRRTSKGTYIKTATVKVRQKGRRLTVPITPKAATLYRFQLTYPGSRLARETKSKQYFGRAVRQSSGGGAALRAAR